MRRASLAYIVYYVAIACTAPYLSPYYRSLGLSLGQVGLLSALQAAVAIVSGPIWGGIHDRYPRQRWLISAAALIAAGSSACLILAHATPLLPFAVVGLAFGVSGTSPMLDVRALDIVGSDRTRFSHLRMWGSLSFLIAAPPIGFVVNATGPSGWILTYIPALVVTAFVMLLLPPRTNAVRSVSIFRAPGRVIRDRTIGLFLVGMLVTWTAVSGGMGFMTVYLRELGATSDRIGLLMSVAAAMEVVAMLLFPRLAARFGVERLILAGGLLLIVRSVIAIFVKDPNILIAASVTHGFGYALALVGSVTFVSLRAPKGSAATAQGVLSGVTLGVASILGNGIGGFVAGQTSIPTMYAAFAGLSTAGVVLLSIAVLPIVRADAAARNAARRAATEAVAVTEPAGKPNVVSGV